MNRPTPTPADRHPWLAALSDGLDALEQALLAGEAPAVAEASAAVQAALAQAPTTLRLRAGGDPLAQALAHQAQRFARLRQGVLRASAQNQRALGVLVPQATPATTYGRAGQGAVRGAGSAYLAA